MRILMVATSCGTINAFLLPHISALQELDHQVEVACHGASELHQARLTSAVSVHEIPFSRKPGALRNGNAYRQLKRVIADGRYDVVHTHTPIASMLVRLAARTAADVRVFYTAHGFHFFDGAPLVNWMVYYPIECYLSRFTDTLVTINAEDYERARNRFRAKRVVLSPGIGLPDRFTRDAVSARESISEIRERFVLLSVGELNANKGHETVIRAVQLSGDKNLIYLIAGTGPRAGTLRHLAQKLQVQDQVVLLGQRSDVEELLSASDVYVHPSHREGLPVAVLEAMRAALPIVASDIRGCRDALGRGDAGLLVRPDSAEEFAFAVRRLRDDPELRTRLGAAAEERVRDFGMDRALRVLGEIYA